MYRANYMSVWSTVNQCLEYLFLSLQFRAMTILSNFWNFNQGFQAINTTSKVFYLYVQSFYKVLVLITMPPKEKQNKTKKGFNTDDMSGPLKQTNHNSTFEC